MSKSGFTTLNRWLGRKNKDKSMPNGKLSKSSTNLSISSTNINETSQLEFNRITPLPAATTNAPFEQTFRITVLLPKDQLYVARLGARVPLSKLLELVCDNKQLDAQKYEFTNPIDPSQVYSCDLTIGAVGLSEIRLFPKSEAYDEDIMKLNRSSMMRESLTSSEFSGRQSKHTTKTTSPYSSSNSLNSMDSAGVHYARVPVAGPPKLPQSTQPKMAAPPRKKRAAPRPPSQVAIPEKSPLILEQSTPEANDKSKRLDSPLATKDFSVSTPNLASSTMMLSDINGNSCANGQTEETTPRTAATNGYSDDTVLYAQVQKKNAYNAHNGEVEQADVSPLPTPSPCLSPEDDNGNIAFPEPSPRKKIVVAPKKKIMAPPAPQPRSHSMYSEDSESIGSATLSSAPSTPVALKSPPEAESPKELPRPQPRITTTTLLNATNVESDLKTLESETSKSNNVSKVLLNRTPTPEPRSLSCEPPDMDSCYETRLEQLKQTPEDDAISKQADSGIGEPVPSPLPDSLPSEVVALDVKSNFESSSDDDDMVKVYNFKLGKTLVKPLNETKTLEELTILNNCVEETDSEQQTPSTVAQVGASATPSETASWNFSIPISPPPNFADAKFNEGFEEGNSKQEQEHPITPKIMERPLLNFESMQQQPKAAGATAVAPEKVKPKTPTTPVTPLDNIVGELSAIIQEKGVDSLIKKAEEGSANIEAAKPNTLRNFTINSGAQMTLTKPKEVMSETKEKEQPQAAEMPSEQKPCSPAETAAKISAPSSPEEEKLYRKRSSVSSLKQRRSITRSDSFHTTAIATEKGMLKEKRTSSQLSLDQLAGNLNRRRSSSELSIGESPSLQSLEVIKTILNSRKNSLANSGAEEESEQTLEVSARRPSEELKFASLELKSKLKDTSRQEEQTQDNSKRLWQRPKEISSEENETENQKDEVTTKDITDNKPQELPKVYRYSGPPSINFSTWSERPKVQVAIKNEGDYIFGNKPGNNDNKTVPRSYRMSMPAAPPLAPKPATIERMGIPETSHKVPITVKPIQDVVVERVEVNNKNLSNGEGEKPLMVPTNNESPTIKVMATTAAKPPRPTVESVLRPQTRVNNSNLTLPRTSKRISLSMAPPAAAPVTAPGPQLLRSTSIKQQDVKFSSPPKEEAPLSAPFGQNTLRRTGLKEKILAKEEQDKQKAIEASNQAAKNALHHQPSARTALGNGSLEKVTSANGMPEKTPATNGIAELQFSSAKPLATSKVHLNLHKSTVVIGSTGMANTTHSSSHSQIVMNGNRHPPAAPAATASTTTTTSSMPPPPPPAPNMMANLKPVTVGKSPMASEDPRDQLLAAIRNFKKDDLKRS